MPKKRNSPAGKNDRAHDAIFKAFFSDYKIARNYLLHYSPPAVHRQIDFSVFRKVDTAFVSGRFGVSFSDVLYETRLTTGAPARLLFLFEHKSFLPAFPIHLQLLDYLLQIWEDDLKNGRPLSIIIPIVIYHGEKSWEQKPFSDFFPDLPEDWRVFIPNFHYLLTDLSRMPEEIIEGKQESEYLKSLFMALKFARKKQWIKQNKEKILTFGEPFFKDSREGILYQLLTVYLIRVSNMTSVEFKELKKESSKPPQQVIDFIHEIFGDEVPRFIREEWEAEARKKGREKGLKEGMEMGMEKGMEKGMEIRDKAITLKTLQKFPDWSDAEVAEFVGVTAEYVQQIRREMVNGV